jgi:phage gpG-like protein
VSFTIEFQPWRPFLARKRKEEIRRWLRAIGDASEQAFKGGMGNYPPASAPGAWPNVRTGRLRGSIDSVVTDDSVTVGSNMHYSVYLRYGTRKMARRKMSDDALKAGMTKARLGKWVEWSRV